MFISTQHCKVLLNYTNFQVFVQLLIVDLHQLLRTEPNYFKLQLNVFSINDNEEQMTRKIMLNANDI